MTLQEANGLYLNRIVRIKEFWDCDTIAPEEVGRVEHIYEYDDGLMILFRPFSNKKLVCEITIDQIKSVLIPVNDIKEIL